ncbi:unnamed protein product (macronuclear) [Paramecium tetraurelia]|uniref:Uncharacterized protein n=1 Tax=Paramecium tetraurelia TaxID=5888 RepID=A0BGG3_PARTE|nr:uncharacterized protein GSPATT00028665001 [Paramecium tetraurelia]CAK57630.1 unnamed protein product [Paramecium tetraurelia]|eukprot:XP_001425028.1 hypothetical protein (macronuclear) [Paramecium tetraurelia strain d4-2]
MCCLILTLLFVLIYKYAISYLRKQDELKQQQFANKAPPQVPETELSTQYQSLKSEVQKMKQDAETLNTTETFAKYSKLQRQLIPKEELLEQLKKQYEEYQESFIKQWEAEQSKIPKPPSISKQLKYIDYLISMVLILGFWPFYIELNNVTLDQFNPILGFIGYKQNEFNNNLTQLWGTNWAFCCIVVGQLIFR